METVLYYLLLMALGAAGYLTVGGISALQQVRWLNKDRKQNAVLSFLLKPRQHYKGTGKLDLANWGPWEALVVAWTFGFNLLAWPLKYLINLPQYFVYAPALVAKNRQLQLQAGTDPDWPQLPAGERMRRLLTAKEEHDEQGEELVKQITAEESSSLDAAAELEAARCVDEDLLPAPKQPEPPQLTE